MAKTGLIGKKITGFRFKSEKYNDIAYRKEMDKHIGEIGEVVDYFESEDGYRVRFNKDYWTYPAELIKKHLAPHPLIITKVTRTRAGKKYYTWQMSKNKQVINHQYNSSATRDKQLAQFIKDIQSENFKIVKK